jgi:hypothetical protein
MQNGFVEPFALLLNVAVGHPLRARGIDACSLVYGGPWSHGDSTDPMPED